MNLVIFLIALVISTMLFGAYACHTIHRRYLSLWRNYSKLFTDYQCLNVEFQEYAKNLVSLMQWANEIHSAYDIDLPSSVYVQDKDLM